MRFQVHIFILTMLACVGIANAGDLVGSRRALMFESDVRPILKTHCFQCHGEGEKVKGGLDLQLRRLMVEGGDTGPAIVPGKSADSLLLALVIQNKMPRGERKLSASEVNLLRQWIDQGAKTTSPEPTKLDGGYRITDFERSFWAFQAIKNPVVPIASKDPNASHIESEIDRFIATKLASIGMDFSPKADKVTLIRRATLDLTGLPPTLAEIDAFVLDNKPDAYSQLLDRLLASPRYGERWARHWLDVAGYADSEGYTDSDVERPYAWKYRDYVIRAFNKDMPFDQFIREQFAGDEMVKPPYENLSDEDQAKLIATGFLRMAPDGTDSNPSDANTAKNQTIADTIEIISTSLLGMTVACARCHDHRYDPIPQTDFYQLRAMLEPAYDWKKWRSPKQRLISLYTDQHREEAKRIESEAAKIDVARDTKQKEYIDRTFEKELTKLDASIREPIRTARNTPVAKRTKTQIRLLAEHPSVNVSAGSLYLYDKKAADDLKQLASNAATIRATRPKEDFIRALTETPHAAQPPKTFLFARGDHDQPKQVIQPAVLQVFAKQQGAPRLLANDKDIVTTGRRLNYAKWLTSGKHPLTARVIVNRVWAQHFGRGIVASLGDFGFLGDRPTHPQLLDWLASDFMASGWKLKRLHKIMMTSKAYRQASTSSAAGIEKDPENRFLWRMPIRRLEAESLRDSILAVSGQMNRQMFGPAVPVMEDGVGQIVIGKENKDGEGKPGKAIPMKGQEFRRSIYIQVRRSRALGLLESFDSPVMSPNCTSRNSSTVAPQALMLMNGQFAIEQAELFARRVYKEAGDNIQEQVKLAWRLAYGSKPRDVDVDAAVAFVNGQAANLNSTNATKVASKKKAPSDTQRHDVSIHALARYCHALISSNRFLYID